MSNEPTLVTGPNARIVSGVISMAAAIARTASLSAPNSSLLEAPANTESPSVPKRSVSCWPIGNALPSGALPYTMLMPWMLSCGELNA
jgi:hypothetical protein